MSDNPEKDEMDELRMRRDAGITEYSVSHVEGLGDRVRDYRRRWKKAEDEKERLQVDLEALRAENARLREQVDIAEKWKALALSYLLRDCPIEHECSEEDAQNCISCWDEKLLEELAEIVWKDKTNPTAP